MPGMPSSSSMESPAAWLPRNRAKHRLSLIFLLALGAFSLVVAYGFAAINSISAVKYVVLIGALFCLAAAWGYFARFRTRTSVAGIDVTMVRGTPGTELKYSHIQFGVLNAIVGCLLTVAGLAAWDFAASGEDIPARAVAAVLAGIAAAFFASFFVLLALGRIRRGRIVLTRDGIYHEGGTFSSFLAWDTLAGVKAVDNGVPEVLAVAYSNAPWQRRQLAKLWKIDKLPPVPMIEIDTTRLAADPVIVYHLVKFYVENSTSRAELGTEASLQRARQGTF